MLSNIGSIGFTTIAPADSEAKGTCTDTLSSTTSFLEMRGSVSMSSETLASACYTSAGNGSDINISGAIGSDTADSVAAPGMPISICTDSGTPLALVCVSSGSDSLGAS